MADLGTPQNVRLKLVDNDIQVLWDAVSEVSSYEVWRKTDSEAYKLISKTTNIQYVDPSLPSGKTYSYYVVAIGSDNSFTIAFNEKGNVFSSFFDYHPSMYIEKGFKFLSTHPDNNKLYEHFKGDYTTYYGTKYPASITLQVNPAADLECVFNNIEFKSELYIEDIDQPAKTLTHLQIWNEYQDSEKKALTLGINSNIKRRFRNWRAKLPRDFGTRDRIRSPWCFLKLELDSEDNSKLILHDVILYYTI